MARVKNPSSVVEGWSESQYWSLIRTALRSGMRFYPNKLKVLNKAKRAYTGENKRQKFEYQCNHCKGWFKSNEVQVDHRTPAGSLLSYQDLPQFVERLYCSEDGLQVLCKQCHQIKTNKERNNEL